MSDLTSVRGRVFQNCILCVFSTVLLSRYQYFHIAVFRSFFLFSIIRQSSVEYKMYSEDIQIYICRDNEIKNSLFHYFNISLSDYFGISLFLYLYMYWCLVLFFIYLFHYIKSCIYNYLIRVFISLYKEGLLHYGGFRWGFIII